jgi:exodeoxyribonuclease V
LTSTAREYLAQITEKLGSRIPPINETQTNLVVTLLNRYEERRVQLVEGAAGTGKTTCLVLTILTAELMGLRPLVTAPTHKAVGVLRSKMQALGATLPTFCTIHSALKLKPQKQIPGQSEKFQQQGVPQLGGYDFMIIDECSMIGDSEWYYIEQAMSLYGIPLILTGDPYQLQPVGKRGKSQTFSVKPRYVLKDVVRHGGAILETATKIRTLGYCIPLQEQFSTESSIFTFRENSDFMKKWYECLTTHHNDTVMLCYMNKHRKLFNQLAVQHLHKGRKAQYAPGDTVVALTTHERDGTILLANNQVVEISEATFIPNIRPVAALDYTFDVWRLGTEDGLEFYTLDDAFLERHTKACQNLSREIKKKAKVIEQAIATARTFSKAGLMSQLAENRRNWGRLFFPLKEAFAEVDFPYASTIHKSQGSTFKDVFLYPDYLKARSEKFNLQYVAVTRSSHNLAVLLPGSQTVEEEES